MTWLAVPILLVAAHVNAAEPDALAISANIQARHTPFGTVLDPFYASAASDRITGYMRCGDSALWTGHYLAADAYRYRVAIGATFAAGWTCIGNTSRDQYCGLSFGLGVASELIPRADSEAVVRDVVTRIMTRFDVPKRGRMAFPGRLSFAIVRLA